jgi:hypothetical protein
MNLTKHCAGCSALSPVKEAVIEWRVSPMAALANWQAISVRGSGISLWETHREQNRLLVRENLQARLLR